jgi:hypothetical protein
VTAPVKLDMTFVPSDAVVRQCPAFPPRPRGWQPHKLGAASHLHPTPTLGPGRACARACAHTAFGTCASPVPCLRVCLCSVDAHAGHSDSIPPVAQSPVVVPTGPKQLVAGDVVTVAYSVDSPLASATLNITIGSTVRTLTPASTANGTVTFRWATCSRRVLPHNV